MRKLALAKIAFKSSWIFFALVFLLLVILALYFANPSQKSAVSSKSPTASLPQNLNIESLAEFAKQNGVSFAYLQLKEKFPGNDASAHDFAHVIGIIAFETQDMQGLSVCDTAYNYGCYHGFIEAFFAKNDVAKVTQIEASCNLLGPIHAPSCLHGIGHGVLVNRSYNVDQALADCSQHLQQTSQIYCFDGVFMENITGSMLAANRRVAVTEQNIDEPCNNVDYIYQNQCWRNQVTVWHSFFQNTKKVGAKCLAIDKEFQTTCLESIGLSIAMNSPQEAKIIVNLCTFLPRDQISQDCLTGVMREIMFEGRPPNLAQSLCNYFKNQQECLALFNSLLMEYHQRFNR